MQIRSGTSIIFHAVLSLLFAGLVQSLWAGDALNLLDEKEDRNSVVNSFTMAGWVRPAESISLVQPRTQGLSAIKGQKFAVYPDPGHKRYGNGQSGAGVSVGINGVMVVEHSAGYFSSVLTWEHPVAERTHITVVYQDGVPTLFVNGKKKATGIVSSRTPHPGTVNAGPQQDRLGSKATGWVFYEGALDDAQVPSLMDSEVKAEISTVPVIWASPDHPPMVEHEQQVVSMPLDGTNVFFNAFRNPSDATRPGTYWYWLRDNISKEGITKDLEAMARVGIGRAYIGNIDATPIGRGSVKMFTDEWWNLTKFAISEGGRLGVDIGTFNCPGWSQAGGPWVKPEQSMRYLAVSETKVSGPEKFSAVLPAPTRSFADVAVLAIPVQKDPAAAVMEKSRVTTSAPSDSAALLDGDDSTVCVFPNAAQTPFVVDINCPKEVTIRSLTLFPAKAELRATCEFQYRDRNGEYQLIKKFNLVRPKKINIGPMLFAPVTEAFAAVTAKEYRLVFTEVSGEAKQAGLAEVELSGLPKVERYIEKQLGQMFPSPHLQWDSYLWPSQPNNDMPTMPLSQVRDISEFMDSTGRLTWDVPQGKWVVLRIGMAPTGVQNNSSPMEGRGLETDKMNAEHVREHFDAYLGELYDRLSPEERKAWKYVVSDSYEMGPQNWTDDLQDEFRARYHYDPLPWLPVLTGRIVENADQSNRFLWDLRRLVADRFAYHYAKPLREKANEHGLTLWGENYGHFGFCADDLQYGGQLDEVAGEFWASGRLGDFEVKTAASSAHIYGKPVVSAESFTFAGAPWSQTPWSLKQRGDWAMAEGINLFILHLFIHQSEERVPGINAWFGTEFNRNNTWFDYMDGWIDGFQRAQAALQQGQYVADLAYFTGEDAPMETGILDPPLPFGYNYDFINGEVIRRDMKVKDGRFVLPGGMSYRLLVLPPLETMRPELLQKIHDLVRDGGAVLGAPPSRSPSLENYPACDEQVRKLAGELWEGIDGETVTAGRFGKGFIFRGTDAGLALKALGILPDIEGIGERPEFGNNQGFTWIHRHTEDADVYFLSNQSDEQKTVSFKFRVDAGTPELWDPVSGDMRALPQFTRKEGRTQVPLKFHPRQSYLVVFRRDAGLIAKGNANFPSFHVVLTLGTEWKVFFDPKFAGPGETRFDHLIDWTESTVDGIKYYSGTAVYRSSFQFNQPVDGRFFLNLGDYESIARVRLNGQDLGVVWVKPGRIEITDALKTGENELQIEVANNWNNRLLGDSKLPEEKRITWTNVDPGIKPHTQLQPSGLTGPVTIERLTLIASPTGG